MLFAIFTSPITELMAVICFIVYVFLSAKGTAWCWAAGFVSSFLYTFVFLGIHLPTQVALNILYMLLAVWGWSEWLEDKKRDGVSRYTWVHPLWHAALVPLLFGLSFALAKLFPGFFLSSHFPLLEATITVFSLYATLLTIHRRIESWIYWFVINGISTHVYFGEGLTQTAMISLLTVFITVWAFYNWRRLRQQDITDTQMDNHPMEANEH